MWSNFIYFIFKFFRIDQVVYGIFQYGVYIKIVIDILDILFDDFVVFYFGCSYLFEFVLMNVGFLV